MQETIQCPKCGADNERGANFCSICGSKLATTEKIDRQNMFNDKNAASGMPKKKKSRILRFGLIAAAVIIIWNINRLNTQNTINISLLFFIKPDDTVFLLVALH